MPNKQNSRKTAKAAKKGNGNQSSRRTPVPKPRYIHPPAQLVGKSQLIRNVDDSGAANLSSEITLFKRYSATAFKLRCLSVSNLYPGGLQVSSSVAWSLDKFFQPWEIQRYDAYRLKKMTVEVSVALPEGNDDGNYAVMQTGRVYTLFISVDPDDSSVLNWSDMQTRSNLGKVCLTTTNPVKQLISFKPRAQYNSSDGGPALKIPDSDAWYDCAQPGLEWGNLKIFFHTNFDNGAPGASAPAVYLTYKGEFEFKYRI